MKSESDTIATRPILINNKSNDKEWYKLAETYKYVVYVSATGRIEQI